MVVNPAWLSLALNAALSLKVLIQKQPARLNQSAGSVGAALQKHNQAYGRTFDDVVLDDMRAGIRFLIDGMNTTNANARDQQFGLARGCFGKLVALRSEGRTRNLSNQYLNAVGYWGNFHYFMANDDPKMALSQVYMCGRDYPSLAAFIFEDNLLNRDKVSDFLKAWDLARNPRYTPEELEKLMNLANEQWRKAQSARFSETNARYGVIGGGIFSAVDRLIFAVNPNDKDLHRWHDIPEMPYPESKKQKTRETVAQWDVIYNEACNALSQDCSRRLEELNIVTPAYLSNIVRASSRQ